MEASLLDVMVAGLLFSIFIFSFGAVVHFAMKELCNNFAKVLYILKTT